MSELWEVVGSDAVTDDVELDTLSSDVVDMTEEELNSEVFENGVVAKEDKTDSTKTSKLTPEIEQEIAKIVGTGEKSVKKIASKLDVPFATDGEKVALVKKARAKFIKEIKDSLEELSKDGKTPEDSQVKMLEKVLEMWKTLEFKEKKVKLNRKQKKLEYLTRITSLMLTTEYEPEPETDSEE